MSKVKKVLKSQTGQGVWEYMVILVGIGAVAFGISKALHGGLVGSGTDDDASGTGKVVGKINELIDGAAEIGD